MFGNNIGDKSLGREKIVLFWCFSHSYEFPFFPLNILRSSPSFWISCLHCGTVSCYPLYTSVSPQSVFFNVLRPFEACFCYYDIIQVVLGWECSHSCPLLIKVHLTVQSRFYLNRVPNGFRRGPQREELIAHEQMMCFNAANPAAICLESISWSEGMDRR